MTDPTPIPPEYITTGCGPGLRIMGEAERRAVDEQRGADRMARAMVAALYWRAGELWATGLVVEILAANTIARAAQRLEACL